MNLLATIIAPYKVITIVGMCKNAGKTTLLNVLCSYGSVALTSIGYDGEKYDSVTGLNKPPVFVKTGDVFTTTQRLLPFNQLTYEVIAATDYDTPLGRVLICRALSYGTVLLAGPSMTAQLAQLCPTLLGYGKEKVLIDGALSRKTSCNMEYSQACILVSGASYSDDYTLLLNDTLAQAQLLCLPTYDGKTEQYLCDEQYLTGKLRDGATAFLHRGALTDSLIAPLLKLNMANAVTLVIEDGTKALLNQHSCALLAKRGVKLAVLRDVNLIGVAVNPCAVQGYAFNKSQLLAELGSKLNVAVFDAKDM